MKLVVFVFEVAIAVPDEVANADDATLLSALKAGAGGALSAAPLEAFKERPDLVHQAEKVTAMAIARRRGN